MTHLQRAADALYPETGNHQAGNVKFFRGLSNDVTAEALAEQLERASAQIAAGEAVRVMDIDAD
jgi:hypothetical protein